MRILIDECVPNQIRGFLGNHDSVTARYAGLGGYKNGQLLSAAEGTYDLLITSDAGLFHRQPAFECVKDVKCHRPCEA